jgi:F0F1-type ATP synthase alpha subunit
LILFAGTNGFVDAVPLERVKDWQTAFLRFMDTQYPAVGQSILAEKRITPENEKALRAAVGEFVQSWS